MLLTLAFVGLAAVANPDPSSVVEIKGLTINYSRIMFPVDRQGFSIPQAIIGGKVDFTGAAPVFVTLNIGGQVFTSPSDQFGNYSFFVYTNGAGRYDLLAWSPNSPQASGISKTSLELPKN